VNTSYELSLGEGLDLERRLFHSTFATEDRAEGLIARFGQTSELVDACGCLWMIVDAIFIDMHACCLD
jgi:hypothetical protein